MVLKNTPVCFLSNGNYPLPGTWERIKIRENNMGWRVMGGARGGGSVVGKDVDPTSANSISFQNPELTVPVHEYTVPTIHM
jgi:hypothetical protein